VTSIISRSSSLGSVSSLALLYPDHFSILVSDTPNLSSSFQPRYQVLHPNRTTGKDGKCKVVPVQAIKAHRGSRRIHPLIINLGKRWKSAVNCMTQPFHSRNKHSVPIAWGRGGLDMSQSRCGHFREEKNLVPLPGIEPTDRPARSLITLRTALSRVRPADKTEVRLCIGYLLIFTRELPPCDKLFSNAT
jgi:hypothetical protein